LIVCYYSLFSSNDFHSFQHQAMKKRIGANIGNPSATNWNRFQSSTITLKKIWINCERPSSCPRRRATAPCRCRPPRRRRPRKTTRRFLFYKHFMYMQLFRNESVWQSFLCANCLGLNYKMLVKCKQHFTSSFLYKCFAQLYCAFSLEYFVERKFAQNLLENVGEMYTNSFCMRVF